MSLEQPETNTMNQTTAVIPAEGLADEIRWAWRQLPDKGFFFSLLAAWLALFHFLGNSTFGYVDTPSLLGWMYNAYSMSGLEGDDGQGLIIPFLVVGLFWWKRKELLALPLRGWWPGLLLVAAALILHILGYLVQQPRLSIVALFAGIYGLTGLAWGPRWLRASFFPFFLFAFMVPLGSYAAKITFPLRILVSWIVEHLFDDVLGIGVLRVGTQLFNSLGTYQFEVAAACSGIRSLTSTLLAATAFGFIVFRSPWKRAAMIVSAVPLAVIGNALRLSLIVGAGEFFGQNVGNIVHENTFFSLLPYVPVFLGLMYISRWLEEPPANQRPAAIT
ncbi:MAG: exosortase/archaeosortase family protein [Verrucomicrobia subdivision 3 bacterium]|nr:exosortase/archaeosortase family protein [Limisphaerales bacterium]